jgi:hypothetical protein
MAYRAHVRAKVACIRHEQGDPHVLAEAAALLEIAVGHLPAGHRARSMAAAFDAWPQAVTIDTSGGPHEALAAARRALGLGSEG